MIPQTALGRELRDARKRAELTLREVAEALGVGVATLHDYESGKSVPDALRLFDLAKLLGINLAGLSVRTAAAPQRRNGKVS